MVHYETENREELYLSYSRPSKLRLVVRVIFSLGLFVLAVACLEATRGPHKLSVKIALGAIGACLVPLVVQIIMKGIEKHTKFFG